MISNVSSRVNAVANWKDIYINIMKAMNYIATINCIELFLYP